MMDFLSPEQLVAIAQEHGSPVYIYNTAQIDKQYKKLTTAFKKTDTKIFYACKALSNINILKHINSLGANLDCVSINEVKLGLMAGFAPENILYTPNCVAIEEIIEAKDLGVNVNIDNISILEQFGNKFGSSYPVCIRLNPHILAGGNYKVSTGHIDSKFGISIHQMRHVERVVKMTGINVAGLHMHTGSEIKDINVFLMGLEVMLEMAAHFPDLKYIDLGSGFKVPYEDSDVETDVKMLGEKLHTAMQDYEKETGRHLQVWFEPGKFLVSGSGYFVVNANVIKQTPSAVFVGVNSGFNHLIRPMFYESYHKIKNLTNPKGIKRLYNVVGNICETDTFAWDRTLNEVRENDLLVFYNAGAYGFEMSSNFNSRLKPAEIMVKDDKTFVIRKRDVFEDLLHNQVLN
jgi:diaminopimelate decarboxylase